MVYVEFAAHVLEGLPLELRSVVGDNDAGDPKAINHTFQYELSCRLFGVLGNNFYLYLLGEIINGHE